MNVYLLETTGVILKFQSREEAVEFMVDEGGSFTSYNHFPTEEEYFKEMHGD